VKRLAFREESLFDFWSLTEKCRCKARFGRSALPGIRSNRIFSGDFHTFIKKNCIFAAFFCDFRLRSLFSLAYSPSRPE